MRNVYFAAAGVTVAVLSAAWTPVAGAAVLQMDFNTDGQLPHQENTNLSRFTENPGTPNTNTEAVSGGYWNLDYVDGATNTVGTRPRILYYAGNNPTLVAGAGVPVSINVRLRFLAPVIVDGASANADRDFAIQARTGAGLLMMLFNYSADGLTNQIIGQGSTSGAAVNTGVSFADFHTYSFVWDGVFDGTGTGNETGVVDVYVDGSLVGTTRAWSGVTNNLGYIEFGDGSSANGTYTQVDWIRWGTGADAIVVPEPASLGIVLAGASLCLRRRRAA